MMKYRPRIRRVPPEVGFGGHPHHHGWLQIPVLAHLVSNWHWFSRFRQTDNTRGVAAAGSWYQPQQHNPTYPMLFQWLPLMRIVHASQANISGYAGGVEGVVAAAAGWHRLRRLSLRRHTRLTASSVEAVANNAPCLTFLDLSQCATALTAA